MDENCGCNTIDEEEMLRSIASTLKELGRVMSSVDLGRGIPRDLQDLPPELQEELIRAMKSRFNGEDEGIPIRYNFGSAHYNYNAFYDFPDETIEHVKSLARYEARGKKRIFKDKRKITPIETVIAEILRDETSLDVDENRIKATHGSTRGAVDYTLKAIVNGDRRVAIPIPNWHFWEIGSAAKDEYEFAYFDGANTDRLVENFRNLAEEGDIGALLLVNPANPLMYKLSEEVAKELDKIALEHGVEIVIDEVLRGVQPIGERDSIGRYFSRPYIIEGFSKRFGDEPTGHLAYVYVPKDNTYVLFTDEEKNCACSEILKAAYKHSTVPAIDELRERNGAFDRGMNDANPDVKIIRPSPTNLITLLELPSDGSSNSCTCNFSAQAAYNGIMVAPSCTFYPSGYGPNGNRKLLRISVGSMSGNEIYEGARILGEGIKICHNGN